MTAARPLTLVVNPASGNGRAARHLPEVAQALQHLGWSVEVRLTSALADGGLFATEAADADRLVVVMGGDGVVTAAATALADHPSARLAVVPAGRGNDFARLIGLGIGSAGRRRAIAAIDGGHTKMVDLGVANGRPFTCIASVGFDSQVVAAADATRLVRGRLVYPYAVLRALASWRPAHFLLDVDGERHELVGYSVAVANGGNYGGGMRLAPQASIVDGLLDVVFIGAVTRLKFLRRAPEVWRGTHLDDPAVHVWRGSAVTVRSEPLFTAYADGEPVGAVPLDVSVRPRALRVLVPAEARTE